MQRAALLRLRSLAGRAYQFLQAPPRSLGERFPTHSFGRGTYGDDLRVRDWGEGARLTIGSFTSIASGVQIFLGGEHRSDWATTFPFSALWEAGRRHSGHPKTKGDVQIGSDVWIGTEALVFSGVTIGHGAVIGARAVVTKDVPPYAVVAGNPSRIVKYRFSPKSIEQLLKIAWWDWSDNRIERALPDMLSPNIEAFIEKASQDSYAPRE